MSQDVENCLCLVLQESASKNSIEKAEETFTGSQIRSPGRLTGLDDVPKITPLIDKESIIGRSTSASVMIMSQSISRVHARITRFNNGLYEITDESSGNGVYLNGVKLAPKTPHSLVVHDEINLCPPNTLCVTFMVEPFDDNRRGAGTMKRELSLTSLSDNDSSKRIRGAATVCDALLDSELSSPPSLAPSSQLTDKDAPSTSGVGEKKEAVKDDLFQDMSDDLMCSICSELYIKATELNCDHVFCESCINEWRRKRQDCPMCRVTITTAKVHKVLNNLVCHLVDRMTDVEKKERAAVEDQREKAKAAAPPTQPPPRGPGRMSGGIMQLRHFHHRTVPGSNVPPIMTYPPIDPSMHLIQDYTNRGHNHYRLTATQHQPPPGVGQVLPRSLPQGWRVVGEPYYNADRPIRARVIPQPQPTPQVEIDRARPAPRYTTRISGPLPQSILTSSLLLNPLLSERPGPFTTAWQRPGQQIVTSTTSGYGNTASTSGVPAARVFVNPAPSVGPATSLAASLQQPQQHSSRYAIDLSRDAIDISSDSDDSSGYSNDDSSPSDSFDNRPFMVDD